MSVGTLAKMSNILSVVIERVLGLAGCLLPFTMVKLSSNGSIPFFFAVL